MFRVKAIPAVLVTSLLLAGCNYQAPGPAVEQPVGMAVDAPRVTVESTGQGDKQLLTFSDIDSEQELNLDITEGFQQDVLQADAAADFRAEDIDTATTHLPLTGSVEEASEATEGQAPATRNAFFTVGEPGFDGDADISSATGFQFGWRAEDNGQMTSLRLAAPQESTDNARAITEQAITKLTALPVVFPDEEIGPGATWTVESRVPGEAVLLQETTYTLESLQDGRAELGVEIHQRPSLGALSLEGQAEGTDLEGQELKVLDSSTNSEGSLTVDLGKPLPVAGHVSMHTKITYGTPESDVRVVQTSATALDFS
ncbi:hypothetical protein [Corynebacterium confusum]|uniref:hypothetical protein n=1 Tax=Corynebacterium confusum TaxID=71254 RepID=UPI0025B2BC4C|nr:hypothetical protein [Corynebacterium confusum]WJY90074.1 hypothetical protein CCONF_07760 [Corynebacterium confusum]